MAMGGCRDMNEPCADVRPTIRTVSQTLTGSPQLLSSSKSLTLPPTTQPLTPLIFMRRAMIPPMAAQNCPSGCSITMIVPSSVKSAQCCPLGMVVGSDSGREGPASESLAMSFRVEAWPTTLGCSLDKPMHGEVGAYGAGWEISIVQMQQPAHA